LQQQHKDVYYDPTFNKQEKEETKAEEKEREEQEKKFDEWQKQEEEAKKLPITVHQGTGEKLTGVSG
jgi:hypothetical protein